MKSSVLAISMLLKRNFIDYNNFLNIHKRLRPSLVPWGILWLVSRNCLKIYFNSFSKCFSWSFVCLTANSRPKYFGHAWHCMKWDMSPMINICKVSIQITPCGHSGICFVKCKFVGGLWFSLEAKLQYRCTYNGPQLYHPFEHYVIQW